MSCASENISRARQRSSVEVGEVDQAHHRVGGLCRPQRIVEPSPTEHRENRAGDIGAPTGENTLDMPEPLKIAKRANLLARLRLSEDDNAGTLLAGAITPAQGDNVELMLRSASRVAHGR